MEKEDQGDWVVVAPQERLGALDYVKLVQEKMIRSTTVSSQQVCAKQLLSLLMFGTLKQSFVAEFENSKITKTRKVIKKKVVFGLSKKHATKEEAKIMIDALASICKRGFSLVSLVKSSKFVTYPWLYYFVAPTKPPQCWKFISSVPKMNFSIQEKHTCLIVYFFWMFQNRFAQKDVQVHFGLARSLGDLDVFVHSAQ